MKNIGLLCALVFLLTGPIQAQTTDENIDAKSFTELVAEKKVNIIDVRTPDEVVQGKMDQAVNINVFAVDFENEVANQFPNKDEKIYLYCRSGKRSQNAIKKLEAIGYTNLVNVDGGYLAIESAK